MNTASFFVTPEMQQRQVQLSFRRKDGQLERWTGQLSAIAPLADPSEGGEEYLLFVRSRFTQYGNILLVHILLGGVGLYITLDDNLTLLRHLLRIKGVFFFSLLDMCSS